MTLAFAPDRIETSPLARPQPYAKNAKQHGADQIAKIAASMAELGWTVPCLVADDGELIAGHGRVLAATQLGLSVLAGGNVASVMVALPHTSGPCRGTTSFLLSKVRSVGGMDR